MSKTIDNTTPFAHSIEQDEIDIHPIFRDGTNYKGGQYVE